MLYLKLSLYIFLPLFFKILVQNIELFSYSFNLFTLMICIVAISIFFNIIYIYDLFSSFFLLEKQGSKLEYMKNRITKRWLFENNDI